MTTKITLEEVKAKLQSEGYTALFFPGECACQIDDLATCGVCEREDGEDWINDCEAGYKHTDPTRPNFWVASASKEPPDQERFDDLFGDA